MRDAGGAITGAVWIVRDGTRLRQQGRRTREALAALVAMAELLVADGPSAAADAARPRGRASPHARTAVAAPGEAMGGATSGDVAQQVAELALAVMGCQHLDIVAEEPPQGGLRLVAFARLTAREERRRRATGAWTASAGHGWIPAC